MVRFAVLVAVVFSCLFVAGCEPLKPSGVPGTALKDGDLQFVLSPEAFELLRNEAAETLRVRVFPVKSGQIGTQEGADKAFPLSSQEFKVSGVLLGRKKFQLHVLDSGQEVVGEAEFIHVVRPGPQSWDQPIVIRLRPSGIRRADFRLHFNVAFELPDAGSAKDYQTDIKPYLELRCVFCHTANPGNQNGIDLTKFPFTYSGNEPATTQDDIVSLIISWLKGNGAGPVYNIMPPFGTTAPQSVLTDFEFWLEQGLAQEPRTGTHDTSELAHQLRVAWKLADGEESGELLISRSEGSSLFEAQLENAVVAGKYQLTVTVLDVQGKEVHIHNSELIMEGDLPGVQINVPFRDPEVVVPVIVER